MTAYVVAQITIHDRERYDRYAAAFMPVLLQYGGRLLAADEAPERLEGDWDRQKVVIIAFADREAAQAWITSPEYRKISKDREAATEGEVVLVDGL